MQLISAILRKWELLTCVSRILISYDVCLFQMILLSVKNGNCYFYFHSRLFQLFKAYPVSQELFFKARNLFKKSEQDFRVNINFEQAWNDIPVVYSFCFS